MNIWHRIRNRIRTLNKYVANPIIRTFAGKTIGPFAIIYHVGRRSGKPFKTPIMTEAIEGGFVMALTYGDSVDWYRNVQVAGHGMLLWHNKVYALEKPEPLAVQTGLSAFPPPLRFFLRLNGTQHFVTMKSSGALPIEDAKK